MMRIWDWSLKNSIQAMKNVKSIQHHHRHTQEDNSQENSNSVRNLLGPLKVRNVLKRMQKAVLRKKCFEEDAESSAEEEMF